MKTICIYHKIDSDGRMSAAIVKKWFGENNQNNTSWIVLEFDDKDSSIQNINQELRMLGWDYGDEIPNLSGYYKVIMVDISFPSDVMEGLMDKEFIWIDHHKSAIEANKELTLKGVVEVNYAACELTWQYFFPKEEMPEIVRLLGRWDNAINEPEIKKTNEWQEIQEFQYAARAYMSNYTDCSEYLSHNINKRFYDSLHSPTMIQDLLEKGKVIYKYLCTGAKQTYAKAFPITFHKHITPTGAVSEAKYKFLCVNQERFNPINFGIDYHKDRYDGFACFWYKDGKWNFSLYNDNGKVDCSTIAKQYGGGGHKGAAEFVCDNNTLIKIIKVK